MYKYLTIELWPEGEMVRPGKYKEVNKVQKERFPTGIVVKDMKAILGDVKNCHYDILNRRESKIKFCEAIWEKSEELK